MTTFFAGLTLGAWFATLIICRATARRVDYLERRLISQGAEHRATIDRVQSQVNDERERLDNNILASYADYEASVETLDGLAVSFRKEHRRIVGRVREVEKRLGVPRFADVHVPVPSGTLFGFVGTDEGCKGK